MEQVKKMQSITTETNSPSYASAENQLRNAFSQLIPLFQSPSDTRKLLQAFWIDTPLGPMLSVADDETLYLLEFVGRKGLGNEINRLQKNLQCSIVSGKTKLSNHIEDELARYFAGSLETFTIPLFIIGSPFQKRVWEELQKIPFGATRSYANVAVAIGKPSAFRAVALANGANQFAILIPCHRVINSNGALGGYGGGIQKKEWLLKHEHK